MLQSRFILFALIASFGVAGVLGACSQGSPSFSLSLSSQRVVLTPGGEATIRVDLNRSGGFSAPIALAVTGGAGDIVLDLNTASTSGSQALLTISSTEATPATETTFQVTATSDALVRQAGGEISVQIPGPQQEGLEEYAAGVEGDVRTLEVNGETLEYEVIDGLAIASGDIILGEALALEESLSNSGLAPNAATCNFGFATEFTCQRWTDGVIGYSFADNWGSAENNSMMRARIEFAIDHWEANTGIRFVRRSSGEYLEFRNSSGCSSMIGRQVITGFDSQAINVGTMCEEGTIIHEIGHAVGLYHEHSRDDRDDFVVVDFGRVRDGKLHNFFQWGEYERDVGPYDYDSIMHYRRWAFARNRQACLDGNLGECTIRPLNGVPATRIGQRDGLSQGDILGAYSLYPPEFEIVGAVDGDEDDAFFLSPDFSTPSVKPEYIRWTAAGVPGELGSGYLLELRSGDLPDGPYLIWASVEILGTSVATDSVSIILGNAGPEVSLAANNGQTEQNLNQFFTVSATVVDAEDGSCEPGICTYTWSPTPPVAPFGAKAANYRFLTVGPQTISVTVEDSSGAVGSATLDVNIVNSPPVVTISSPAGPVSRSTGSVLALAAEATDINADSGTLACSALAWTSSNGSDSFSPTTGCNVNVTLGNPGARTITVTATDPQGASAIDTTSVTVTACEGNCQPSVSFTIQTPPDYNSATSYPGYFRNTEISILATISDADVPPDTPIAYTLRALPPCIGGCPITIATGNATTSPQQIPFTWTPNDDWTFTCNGTEYPFEIRLTVTDDRGAMNSYFETIVATCEFI